MEKRQELVFETRNTAVADQPYTFFASAGQLRLQQDDLR